MTDETPIPVTENAPVESTLVVDTPAAPSRGGGRGGPGGRSNGRNDRGGGRGGPGGNRNRGRRDEKPRSEFDQKIIQLRRVSRVQVDTLSTLPPRQVGADRQLQHPMHQHHRR